LSGDRCDVWWTKRAESAPGDLSGPLDMRQHDEIGVLAHEMNEMCDRLRAAQEKLADETERRLAAGEQLRHADRLTTVGKLASGVAHELGTPLNVVSGRAKMIVRGQAPGPPWLESAQTIVEQSERMTQIIKQLLGFARRRQPQQKAREPARDRRTHAGPASTYGGKGGDHICIAGQAYRTRSCEVDASMIEQALTNLVVNAIQAMPTAAPSAYALAPT
jgi:two-component system NtrC family sensor kinase